MSLIKRSKWSVIRCLMRRWRHETFLKNIFHGLNFADFYKLLYSSYFQSVNFHLIIISRFLFYDGLTLFPFIILRHKKFKDDKTLINHERIHLQQQMELLVLPFYFIYLLNYLVNLLIYRNHALAYRNIVFEREAFLNEKDLSYLKRRKLWEVNRYLFAKG